MSYLESGRQFFVKSVAQEAKSNNTTLAADNELTLDLIPGFYEVAFSILFRASASSNGGVKFGFYSTSNNIVGHYPLYQVADGFAISPAPVEFMSVMDNVVAIDTALTWPLGARFVSAKAICEMLTADTLELRWAQNSSSTAQTQRGINSWLRAVKVD